MSDLGQVVIAKGRARPLWCGNPLLFSGAVESVSGSPEAGDPVRVVDATDRLLGVGVYNPHSQYRVRLLTRGTEPFDGIAAVLRARVDAAVRVRQAFGLPSAETDAYRLLNSEGDGVSGLTVDVFGSSVVVSSSAYWVERYRADVIKVLEEALSPCTVAWSRAARVLAQDGWPGVAQEAEDRPDRVIIRELGVAFRVWPGRGQKTGFYCDQRENRRLVRSLARGRRCADLFSFSGGFALNAALGGAREVVAVDSSSDAIAMGADNARDNDLDVRFVCTDALEWLESDRTSFDMIVLDPPKFAPSRRLLDRAAKHYRRLNRAALARLAPGGLLATFSCSAAMDSSGLEAVVRDAAAELSADVRTVATLGAGADHPVLPGFPEGRYLTGLVVFVR